LVEQRLSEIFSTNGSAIKRQAGRLPHFFDDVGLAMKIATIVMAGLVPAIHVLLA
jgi:hypothetical protein